jgi:hypothetical protein
MSSWRDHILREFTPNVARLTLVADPDGLLLEEGILEGIRERGFELIPFEDHVAFRYAYESRFRARCDRGEQTELVVVLRSPDSDLGSLPYDLLQVGRRLFFSLGDIFPNLSYSVVTALDRSDLDALYEAQQRHTPGQLGDNATKEFVLRHVFEITPELIKQPSDLLRVLLRRHYRKQRIPAVLDTRFIQLLRQSNTFRDWPLEIIIPDREAFFAFLQERWPVFLDRIAKGDMDVQEESEPYALTFSGPRDLPFDHHDVRVYIDNLFLEGILQPISHRWADSLSRTWAGIGVRLHSAGDRERRLHRLVENIRSSIPAADAGHGEWFRFARGWAELAFLAHDPERVTRDGALEELKELQNTVDATFTAWLARRYTGLINLPPAPPVMLHHIPRFLARRLEEDTNPRIALLVVDGLSYDQWIVVREEISLQQPNLCFREGAVFAWIPTITPVSRQAVFAGKPPIFFPNSIYTTDKEPLLWKNYWTDQGLSPHEVTYARGLGGSRLDSVEDLNINPKTKVAGLVIDKIDKIMHGMVLGTAGMHNQVRQWARQFCLTDLLNLLLDQGFNVFLTSDHGNIEAGGCGRPAEGVIADVRGERVRIYPNELLREQVRQRFSGALKWPPIGLPEYYLALLAPDRKAFVPNGECLVSHGGITIEELIVPFIQIERRAT